MKKIFILLALVFTTSIANAWYDNCHEGIVILATEHLSPKAKSAVDNYLGDSYKDDIKYLYKLEKAGDATHTEEIHYLHLNKKFKPITKKNSSKNDAYAAINKQLEVIKAHNKYSKAEVTTALRTLIDLMCDIHDLAHIRIKGYPHSYDDFIYLVPKSEYGKAAKKYWKVKWSKTWNRFGNYPAGFSGAFRAYDMKLCLDGRFEQFTKGGLLDWIADNGAMAASYLDICAPEEIVPFMVQRQNMEDDNYDMMIKASCRLAKLLNEAFK
ncbi:MAG: hypothetical protein J6Q01_03100 [Alistipes sp.]|nr:hypothetical protein [Alistipes sp.]